MWVPGRAAALNPYETTPEIGGDDVEPVRVQQRGRCGRGDRKRYAKEGLTNRIAAATGAAEAVGRILVRGGDSSSLDRAQRARHGSGGDPAQKSRQHLPKNTEPNAEGTEASQGLTKKWCT